MRGVVFFLVLVSSLYSQTPSTLEEEFLHYVPKEVQTKCNGVGEICKKFYVGYYLLDYKHGSKTSIKYLTEVYKKKGFKVIDDMEAKPYYLAMSIAEMYEKEWDLENAEKYYKLALEADNSWALCSLGNIYKKQKEDKKAIKVLQEGADKHIATCYTNLGLYYFNDEYGGVNKELGGEYWKKAYNDESYGRVENYNLGVYYEYKGDKVKTKFYTLKAAYLGDRDAKEYLKTHLQNVSTTGMFTEEALGSHVFDVRGRKTHEFSSYDLYYRFKKMFNKQGEWEEDTKYRDKRWDKDMSNVAKFDKGKSSLIFENKQILFQTTLTSFNRDEVFSKEIELFYKVLFVDLSDAKNVVDLHHLLIGLLLQDKDFHYVKEFSVDGFSFTWDARYNAKSKELFVKILL